MSIISLFSGAGGLDLGFKSAGFNITWANENDKTIWETYQKNHTDTVLDKRGLSDVPLKEIPNCIGIIGGPPCQSWSIAGNKKGLGDKRGRLFFDFIRVLKAKKPLFFVLENVPGLVSPKHKDALDRFKKEFKETGYDLSIKLLDSKDFGVPQDRKRVFFVGHRQDVAHNFKFPAPREAKLTLKDAIEDLKESPLFAKIVNRSNKDDCAIPNHEYFVDSFSSMYMSRNRVRGWDERSFTIQASGRHAPLHPQAPKMIFIDSGKRAFDGTEGHLYRRLTIRECARIQTFPDDFIFYYDKLDDGYKMVGNAVPVNLAYALAKEIKQPTLR